MRRNAERRTQLLDAAIRLLAKEGTRGLTYRALEAEAGLPTGTASNYFRNRSTLLLEIAQRIHERLAPDPAWLQSVLEKPSGKALLTELLQNLVTRTQDHPDVYLALLELRLEGTRQPGLQKALTQFLQSQYQENQRFTQDQQLPVPAEDFMLLYLATTGLLVEKLTSPELVEVSATEIIQTLVDRLY